MALATGILVTAIGLAAPCAHGQAPPAAPAKGAAAESVVRQWFERWNALDGSEAATSRLLELYLPGAYQQIGPNEKQLGEVRFEGQAALRKMIDDFARTHTEISFRIQAVVANETTVEMIHIAQAPWGGVSAAVEYAAAYTTRKDKRRWMYPGAAFFQIQDGKIRGLRLYMARDELMEVFSR
jgi:ketosteroid isomerase-like protein